MLILGRNVVGIACITRVAIYVMDMLSTATQCLLSDIRLFEHIREGRHTRACSCREMCVCDLVVVVVAIQMVV